MSNPLPSLFIVRAGDFGADLAPRFWFSVFAICLLAWDLGRHRRLDYLWVGVTGLVVWTTVEAVLQMGGTREIGRQTLFGVVMPVSKTILLQGLAEGASAAILGVFLGDRLLNRETRLRACAMMGVICVAMLGRGILSMSASHPVELDVTSRRNLGAAASLAFLGSVAMFDLFFFVIRPKHRRRIAAMACVIFLVASVWTVNQVMMGARWVEVVSSQPAATMRATGLLAVAALGFDVLIEITAAYIAFYAIPALAGRFGTVPIPGTQKSSR